MPQSRTEFWNSKLAEKKQRDELNIARLQELSWECLTLWECELRDLNSLTEKLVIFLGPTRMS